MEPMKVLFACLSLLVSISQSLHFASQLEPLQNRCFAKTLSINEKYKVDVYPIEGGSYTFKIDFFDDRQGVQRWQRYHIRKDIPSGEPTIIHKVAPIETSYRFCMLNLDPIKVFRYSIDIKSGVDLMDFHHLPNRTDTEQVAEIINWVASLHEKVEEEMKSVAGMRSSSEMLSQTLGSSISTLTIIFSFLVVGLNVVFYIKFKKDLNSRKNK